MTKAFDFIKYLFRNWDFWPTYFGDSIFLFFGGLVFTITWEINQIPRVTTFVGFRTSMIMFVLILFGGIFHVVIKPLMKSYHTFNKLREDEHNKLIKSLSKDYEN